MTGSSQDTQDQVTITYETLRVKFFSTAIKYMNNDLFDLTFRILDVRIDSSKRSKHIPMRGRKSQYIDVNGESLNTDGALLYFIKPDCSGAQTIGHCPPYDATKQLTCVVCTR